MSVWYTIKDIDDIEISDDKKELEILFKADYNGNNYVFIPIEMIMNQLEKPVMPKIEDIYLLEVPNSKKFIDEILLENKDIPDNEIYLHHNNGKIEKFIICE